MISLIKDLFNPLNWYKLFKNPKKVKVLYIRLFSYPGMNFKNIKLSFSETFIKSFSPFFKFYCKKK